MRRKEFYFFFREENRDTENKVGRQFRPLYDIPYLFEAREFLRKRLVGKKVQVCLNMKYSTYFLIEILAKNHQIRKVHIFIAVRLLYG